MHENLWRAFFRVERRLGTLPRPSVVASDRVADRKYHFDGKNRPNRQCLFQYTLKGRGVFWDARGRHAVPVACGFLCRVNDPETGYFWPEDSGEPWEHVFFTFFDADDMVAELVSRFGAVFAVPSEMSIIQRLCEYRHQDDTTIEVSPGQGASLVMSLLCMLADAGMAATRDTSQSWLVCEAQRIMRSRVEEAINVTDIARALQVSPEHLCRVFGKEMRVTPLKHLTEIKIRRARDLLRDTCMSCKEICDRLGYDNASHFARAFRRVVGISPREFRRQNAPLVY